MANSFQVYGLMYITSLVVTLILVLPVSKLAYKLDIVDRPGLHKTHSGIKPLLGGLAIFAGITFAMLVFSNASTMRLTLFIAMLILLITGLIDDIYNIKPLQKMAGQTAAATIVVIFNLPYYHLFFEFFERFYMPAPVIIFLIISWIVLMVNAFNLIDGLDGLAAGTAAIIFTTIALITLLNSGSSTIIALQVICTGACVGFLIFNFNPARIFMGDTGSMLLGFLLATTFLLSLNSTLNGSLIMGSIFIFAYPALDVIFAIIRRLRNRTSIFAADKSHIHHVLMSLGFSIRKTVIIIYMISILFSIMAVALLSMKLGTAVIISIGLITFAFTLTLFRYLTVISRRNGLHLHGKVFPERVKVGTIYSSDEGISVEPRIEEVPNVTGQIVNNEKPIFTAIKSNHLIKLQ